MTAHPTKTEVLRFLKGELAGQEEERFLLHLKACPSCRERLTEESRLDTRLRQGVARSVSPPGLQARVRAALDEAARQETASTPRHRGAWVSSLVAASIAAALLVLGTNPRGMLSHLPQGLASSTTLSVFPRTVDGSLVCLGCARAGAPVAAQQRCPGGNRDHVTALKTGLGRFWRFVEDGASQELMADPGLRGSQVQVVARAYEDIGYLEVLSVHPF